jgi:hypothetical protein
MSSSRPWGTRNCLRFMATLATAVVLLAPSYACNEGAEGDRCNPSLSHDECGAGLSCQTPSDPKTGATCGESYCCPTPATSSSNSFCNGSNFSEIGSNGMPNCPTPAGVDSGANGDDAGSTEGGALDGGGENAEGGDAGAGAGEASTSTG